MPCCNARAPVFVGLLALLAAAQEGQPASDAPATETRKPIYSKVVRLPEPRGDVQYNVFDLATAQQETIAFCTENQIGQEGCQTIFNSFNTWLQQNQRQPVLTQNVNLPSGPVPFNVYDAAKVQEETTEFCRQYSIDVADCQQLYAATVAKLERQPIYTFPITTKEGKVELKLYEGDNVAEKVTEFANKYQFSQDDANTIYKHIIDRISPPTPPADEASTVDAAAKVAEEAARETGRNVSVEEQAQLAEAARRGAETAAQEIEESKAQAKEDAKAIAAAGQNTGDNSALLVVGAVVVAGILAMTMGGGNSAAASAAAGDKKKNDDAVSAPDAAPPKAPATRDVSDPEPVVAKAPVAAKTPVRSRRAATPKKTPKRK